MYRPFANSRGWQKLPLSAGLLEIFERMHVVGVLFEVVMMPRGSLAAPAELILTIPLLTVLMALRHSRGWYLPM